MGGHPLLAHLLSGVVVTYALVPLGVMIVSWVAQRSFSMRPNAAGDIFAFALGLDLAMLVQQSGLASRVNPELKGSYVQLFALALLVSVGFLIYAAKVQSLIHDRRPGSYYPLGRVIVCWAVAFAVVGFHLYALVGT